MKRKYAALMLGVTMVFSSMTVYAEETTEAAVMDAVGEMEVTEEENTLYGEITEIGEDSITIALGMMRVEEIAEAELDADDTTEVEIVEPEKMSEEAVLAEQAEERELEESAFEFAGEEKTVSITEETAFFREILSEISETPEELDGEVLNEDVEMPKEDTKNKENTEEVFKESLAAEEQNLEAITLEELQEGDVLKITLDEEGNAETVTVLWMESEELQEDSLLEEISEEEMVMTLEEVETDIAIAEE